MEIVCMAEDGHALSCDFSLLRSTLVRMNSVVYCGFLALPSSLVIEQLVTHIRNL